jgi:hypothetical protein
MANTRLLTAIVTDLVGSTETSAWLRRCVSTLRCPASVCCEAQRS